MEGLGDEEGTMQMAAIKEGIDMAQEDLRSKAVAITTMRVGGAHRTGRWHGHLPSPERIIMVKTNQHKAPEEAK